MNKAKQLEAMIKASSDFTAALKYIHNSDEGDIMKGIQASSAQRVFFLQLHAISSQKFAEGGLVPGGKNTKVKLNESTESILNVQAASRLGAINIDKLNQGITINITPRLCEDCSEPVEYDPEAGFQGGSYHCKNCGKKVGK